MTQQETTIYDLGFGKALTRNTKVVGLGDMSPSSGLALLPNSVTSAVNPSTIQSGSLVSNLEQNAGVLYNVKTSFTDATAGYRLGIDTTDDVFKFLIGNSTNSLFWNGTSLIITGNLTATTGAIGGFEIGTDYIRDVANTFGLASTVSTTAGGTSISNTARAVSLNGTAGLTMIQNASVDDANIEVVLPFSVTFNGVAYTSVFVGSNGYLTFGAGSSAFSGLSASNPAIPGIHINARDGSYQRVYKGSLDGNATYIVRYEGAVGTSGTPGSSTVFWEVKFTAATPDIFLIDIGDNAASAVGTSGITSGATYVATFGSGFVNQGYTLDFTLTAPDVAVDDVRLWAGDTFANRASAEFRVTESGALVATSATITGAITASSGSITGAFSVLAGLSVGTGGKFTSGQTAYDTGTGWWMEFNAGTPRMSLGNSAGNKLTWNGTTLTVTGTLTASAGAIGGFDIGTDYIRDAANSFGLASTVTGGDDVRFWAGSTFAARATAPARITEAGAATFSSITITGGSITTTPISGIPNSAATDISLLAFTHDIVFSVTNATTIAWSAGTITLSNGRTFSIAPGSTGVMAALTYIYLDPGVSSTVLQTTVVYSTAIGANKQLIGTAQNHTVTASFIPFGGGQPLIDGQNIGALSIVAGNIAASTITAGKLSVSTLSAITADMGTITAGSITAGTATIGAFAIGSTTISATNLSLTSGAANTANISVGTGSNLGGMNSGNAGTDIAFWAGATFANRATAPFRVNLQGDVTMTSATISGIPVVTQGTFGGDGSDGALSTSSGTTTIDCGGAAYIVKNYTSISVTGTATVVFTNPNANGTFIIIKCQGNATITTSAVAFNASGCGADSVTNASYIFDTLTHNGSTGSPVTGGGGNGAGGVAGAQLGLTTVYLFQQHHTFLAAPGAGGGNGRPGTRLGGGGFQEANGTSGGVGGRGGGVLIFECNGAWNFTTGSISVAGAAGTAGSAAGAGGGGGSGGGGGASGMIGLLYRTLTADSGTYTITGGAAGVGGTCADNNGAGGGGGGGAGSWAAAGSAGSGGSCSSGNPGASGGAGAAGLAIRQKNITFA